MAKRIRISSDGGTTWNTLPGSTGEFANEMDQLEDTIFGASYESNFPGLINSSFSANAYVKGFAGYMAKVSKLGTPTAATGLAMTLVSGKTYQATLTTRQIWDRSVAVVVKDGVTTVTAQVESIDYLFGRITFKSTYTPVGAITVDATYMTQTQIAKGRGYNLTQTANAVETSDMPTVQANGGVRTFQYGLKTVELELTGVFASSNAFITALKARSEVIIEINPDGNAESIARGFFRYTGQAQEGDVGDLEEETINFSLSVPDSQLLQRPFGWQFSVGSTLNTGVKDSLNAWQNESALKGQYLYDGTNGYVGDVIVTEISVSGDMDSMNEFSLGYQYTGATTAVP